MRAYIYAGVLFFLAIFANTMMIQLKLYYYAKTTDAMGEGRHHDDLRRKCFYSV